MRGRRLIFVSTLATFLVMGISLGSARALDWGDWVDKWFKIKIQIKATCEDLSSAENELFADSVKDTAGIYISQYNAGTDDFDACLLSKNEDGTWQSTYVKLAILLGSADDAVLGSEESDTIVDGDREIDFLFTVRLTGKEKKNEFKSGKVKTVSGTAFLFVEDEADCIASLSFSGKYLKEEKVPDEVKFEIPCN
jgi:hypothetical protein